MDSRIDTEPGSLAVMIPVPAEIAAQWPADYDQQPHVSVVIADPVTDAQALEAVLVVACEFCVTWSDIGRGENWVFVPVPTSGPNATTLSLDGLAYFDLPNDRVAFARVQVTDALRQVRSQIADRLRNIGVTVRNPAQWVPHATLARVPTGTNYTGPIPSGTWPLKTIEVWRDDTRYILTTEDSTIDKMVKSASDGWDAWTQAGRTSVGSFATEVQAREALRVSNLEYILRGRRDGDRTEAERDAIAVAFAAVANMPPAEFKAWLDSDFSGRNRKSGAARVSARNVGALVLGLLQAEADAWTLDDYESAAKIVASVERLASAEPGEPLEIYGRAGPTTRDAELMDLGHDPRKDACKPRGDRADARGGWIWRTQGDNRVRPTHAAMDGRRYDVKQRDADHGIPGEEFGCRCYPEIVPQRGTRREADAIDRVTARAKMRAAERWRNDGAPAVHTESRTHVDYVLRSDAVELLPPEFLPNGWRRYSVLYSRTGCQTYYPNGVAVVEWRSPEEVFSAASLDSGRGLPWELRHSPDLLRPDTVQGVAQGCTLTFEPHVDGIHTGGIAQAWGLDLFDAIDGRKAVQVSLAYGCKVDRRPGTTDDGQRFDQRQIAILLNSLASEPNGRAGSARVITERLDSSPVITRRDSLLALANSGRIVRPVLFDRTNWRPASPRKDTDDMLIPNEILMAMLAAAKKTMAEVAAAVGVSEADAVKLLTGETEASPEQLAMIKAAMVVERDDAPAAMAPPKMPAMPAMMADTMVKIGDADVMLPAAAANEIITLRERVAMAGERADSASAEARQIKAELAAKGDMITRTDAAAMVVERGMLCADMISLCRAANGDDWTPSARKDAAGKDHPITPEDLQRAVITAVLPGAEAILKRIDGYPAATQAGLLTERVEDARSILVGRGNRSAAVKREIAENLAGITVLHADKSGTPGPVAKAEQTAKENAGAIKTAHA